MTKEELRKEMKVFLSSFGKGSFSSTSKNKTDASSKACTFFLDFAKEKKIDVLLSYDDLQSEISPKEINKTFLSMEKIVALPKTIPGTRKLHFYILDSSSRIEEQLSSGSFGINEPEEKDDALFRIEDFKGKNLCVIVPGLAFGKKGERLGRGKGFYDTYLSFLKRKCKKNEIELFLSGFCFDFQIRDFVPVDSCDVRMNAIFSDSGFFVV